MLPSTTFCTGSCQLPRFLRAMNLQALAAWMGRDQTEYLWCPGGMVNSLSGMLHPQIPLPPPIYSSLASTDTGLVAARAEELKEAKYALLVSHHIFTPVVIETGGVVGPHSFGSSVVDWSKLREMLYNSFAHLLQHLSIAVQQGNAASVLGSIDHSLPDENCL